jgi:beta-phosphoglucomutase-like phosphatase (HAD superfamily)
VTRQTPTVPRHPELDELTVHWRIAFNAADDAVGALAHGGGTVALPEAQLAALRREIADQRVATARALSGVAGLEHVSLHARVDAPRPTNRALGLPDDVRCLVFDLDGVLAPTDELHAAAWAETFDELLTRRVERTGERFAPFRPFDTRLDYPHHLHGRPRLDGIRAFLASRGIRLPDGTPNDSPGSETVHGLANRKNEALRRRLREGGLEPFAGSRSYLAAAREAGLHCAVVSASANTAALLDGAGLAASIELRVDAAAMVRDGLLPQPAPDVFLAACERLGFAPHEAAVFVTSGAGVAAGRAAHAAVVVGVDRRTDAASIPIGADRVVHDLGSLLAA